MSLPEVGKAIVLIEKAMVERNTRGRWVQFHIDMIPERTIVLVWSHDPVDPEMQPRQKEPDSGPWVLWNDYLWVCVNPFRGQGIDWEYV